MTSPETSPTPRASPEDDRPQLINRVLNPSTTMHQRAKGTTDYYPQDWHALTSIMNTCRTVATRYGFQDVESPAFEELKLLSEKEGEETKEQIFVLEKRGDESYGLRFDMTVPLARMFISVQKSIQKPVKWSYGTRMWRYERPQKGRGREFYQYGVELFGSDKPDADAEVITLAIECMKALGLNHKDIFVNVNNRNLIQGILTDLVPEESVDEALAIIDKRKKIQEDEFFKLLKSIHVKDPAKLIEILDLADLESIGKIKLNPQARKGYEELKAVLELVDPDFTRLSLSTVRGLAYYTGTVFEIFDTQGTYRSLCGGGRYDNLISLFGGESTPAVGFGIGLHTLPLVLEEKGKLPGPPSGPQTYIAIVDDSVRQVARQIATRLRNEQAVEIDLTGRSLSKQLAHASTLKAATVIIVGPKDVDAGKITRRDLVSGKEETIPLDDILGKANRHSGKHENAKSRHPPRSRRP